MELKCPKCGSNIDKYSIFVKSYDPLTCATCHTNGCTKCFLHDIKNTGILSYKIRNNDYYFCSIDCASKFTLIHNSIRKDADERILKRLSIYEKENENRIRKIRNTYNILPKDIIILLNNFICKYPEIVNMIIQKNNAVLLNSNLSMYSKKEMSDLKEILDFSGYDFEIGQIAFLLKVTYYKQIIDDLSHSLPIKFVDLDNILRKILKDGLIDPYELESFDSELKLLILRKLLLSKYKFKIGNAPLKTAIKKNNVMMKKESLLQFKRDKSFDPSFDDEPQYSEINGIVNRRRIRIEVMNNEVNSSSVTKKGQNVEDVEKSAPILVKSIRSFNEIPDLEPFDSDDIELGSDKGYSADNPVIQIPYRLPPFLLKKVVKRKLLPNSRQDKKGVSQEASIKIKKRIKVLTNNLENDEKN